MRSDGFWRSISRTMDGGWVVISMIERTRTRFWGVFLCLIHDSRVMARLGRRRWTTHQPYPHRNAN